MKSSEFITDAVRFGDFPDDSVDQHHYAFQMSGATKLSDITNNLSLWQKDEFLILHKDQKDMVGFVKISKKVILDNTYNHIDLIYIKPEYRNTSAIKWLLYSIKEYAASPVIADGAIFAGGEELIMSLGKHGMAEPKVLNKETGEKTALVEPINDPTLCYLFESTNLGPGKNYFNEDASNRSLGWVWYADTLFKAI
jgi:hypothetical protein